MYNKDFIDKIKSQFIEHDIEIIVDMLENENKNIFSDIDLGKIFIEYKAVINDDSNIFSYITKKLFIETLLDLKTIHKIPIKSSIKNFNRYLFKDANIYEKALSLNSGSYLSHYTAVFLHNLTLNVPKVIYTNTEQYKKPNKIKQTELKQINIDKAFSREFRKTNNIAYLKDEKNNIKIVMLNGKYTNNSNLELLSVGNSQIPVTNLERTLIDVMVRPDYSGGIPEVINVFKNAKEEISIGRLISILNNLDYIYPYHQSLGFYLELAGYSENILKRFDHYDFKYNFYLTYKMIDPSFSERWKIYYPNYINY